MKNAKSGGKGDSQLCQDVSYIQLMTLALAIAKS
jgi:hypothetical protein